VMTLEPTILDSDDTGAQCGRDVIDAHPRCTQTLEIDTIRLDDLAVTVEQVRVRRRPFRAHRGEIGRRATRAEYAHSGEATERDQCDNRAGTSRRTPTLVGVPGGALIDRAGSFGLHFAATTSRRSFGRSPSISGAYIASTRVAGRWNVPGLL